MLSDILDYTFVSIVGIAFLWLIHEIWLDDAWKARKALKHSENSKKLLADKLGQIKLTSSDDNEIEKFITDNITHLDPAMIEKLISRIEIIRHDRKLFNEELSVVSKIDGLAAK